MGFGLTSGGLTIEEVSEEVTDGVLEELKTKGLDIQDDDIVLGDADAGIIIHQSPGQTKFGEQVDDTKWVEIYGPAVYFSEV